MSTPPFTLPSRAIGYACLMRQVVSWRAFVLPVIVSIVGLLLALVPHAHP